MKEKIELAKNFGQAKKKKKTTVDTQEAGKRVKEHRKVIALSEESIKVQTDQLIDLRKSLGVKIAHLQKLRTEIADVKGNGTQEDVNFHIDRSRDDRGFTFLMSRVVNKIKHCKCHTSCCEYEMPLCIYRKIILLPQLRL